jgi:hypothetical protein
VPDNENRDFEELDLPDDGLEGAELLSELDDGQELAELDTPDGDLEEALLEEGLVEEEVLEEAELEEELEEETPKKPGFLSRLRTASPYTVMLALALMALLIGCTCLLLEWASYGFNTGATS